MILALLGCIPAFPPPLKTDSSTVPDTDTDTDTDTDSDTDTDTDTDTDVPLWDEPVQATVEELAGATAAGRRWPTGTGQLDDDAPLEILASHPWQASFDPASWMALEPDGLALAEVAAFPPRPIEAGGSYPCMAGDYEAGLYLASADGHADIDGDGQHDVVVGTRSTAGGGLVTLMRSPEAPLSADPLGDVVSWCFEGDEQFGGQVLLVPDAFGGPAVAVSLAVGTISRPAGIALYDANTAPGTYDGLERRLWLTLDEAQQGASVGGTIGAADFDGDGVASLLIGAGGDGGYDGARVWALDQEITGEVPESSVDIALMGRVSADHTHPVSSCTVVPIATGDIDGDGAVEALMGFSPHDRLAVAGDGEFLPDDGAYADDLAGIKGSPGTCFGASIALLAQDGPGLDVAISAPAADEGAGGIWVVEGVRLRMGLLDVAAGDYRLAITSGTPGAELGGALAGGDVDGDGLGDLIAAETGSGEVTWLLPGSSL